MPSAPSSRLSFHIVSSPYLLAGSFSFLLLLLTLMAAGASGSTLGPWGRLAALVVPAFLVLLLALDGIQKIEIGADGIHVASLATLLFGGVLRSSALQAGRNFLLTWSSVDAVELRLSRFQSPFRRRKPRGWLLAGSPGQLVRIPFGHPQFRQVLEIFRRFIHPYFVHLPSRDWEGKIPGRPALAQMLRTIVFDPSTPSEFIAETARACLLWGSFSRAERLMDLALAKREGDLKVLDDYFLMMKRLGNIEKAKPALQQLLQSRNSTLDLVEMAEVHHAEGEEKEAAECLLQAAERDQESDLAHFLLGCLYVRREGLQETALDQWKKGLERARHPQLLGKLGETYRYHRELTTSPDFLRSERRRQLRSIWSRRLGIAGVACLLTAVGAWWSRPSVSTPLGEMGGALLLLGGALMLAALLLRPRGRG
ncbi:MAG TPA: hypothetical protein VKL61_07555 [Candidatus Polarisedimenticolia bacterium]|nr:hypothetical protein [Candidatus Polarisedimenticolia bacterium]